MADWERIARGRHLGVDDAAAQRARHLMIYKPHIAYCRRVIARLVRGMARAQRRGDVAKKLTRKS